MTNIEQTDLNHMAGKSFGYGRWEAPFWFIGPEQGMSKNTARDLAKQEKDLRNRIKAWIEAGSRELNDCREFHGRIGEDRWHFKERVNLQTTWKALILVLLAALDREHDRDSRRRYQSNRWGSTDISSGETCVIELSGLPKPRLARQEEENPHTEKRIQTIRERIVQHKPKLVFMYGLKHRADWNKIAGTTFQVPSNTQLKKGTTLYVFGPHPSRPIWNGRVWGSEDWVSLGKELRLAYPDSFSDL